MKLEIDPTTCQGYGRCAEVAPELVDLDEFGYATPAGDGTVGESDVDKAREAVVECPAKAISLS